MKKLLLVLFAAVLTVSMVLVGCAQPAPAPAPAPPPPKPVIKISDLFWGSAHFQSEVARIIIEEGYGYPVELVPGKSVGLFQGLRRGDIDVLVEGWLPNWQEMYDKAIAAGDIVNLGILNNDNWQSLFVVPTYVVKGDNARGIQPMAPNLESVFDLDQKQYKELFKNPENPNKGVIMNELPGGEAERINVEKLAAYGLDDDYDLLNPGSREAHFAGLVGAYEKGEPYITYMWGPTWIAGKFDLTLLEEPPYDEALWNEENQYACAYPSADMFIAAHKDFPGKAPELVLMFNNWKLNTKTLGEALSYMDETGGEPIDAAIWHLKNREAVWTKFVPADVAQKVKDAVAKM